MGKWNSTRYGRIPENSIFKVTVITSPKEIILSNTEITIDLSSGNKTVQITPTITPDSANKNIT